MDRHRFDDGSHPRLDRDSRTVWRHADVLPVEVGYLGDDLETRRIDDVYGVRSVVAFDPEEGEVAGDLELPADDEAWTGPHGGGGLAAVRRFDDGRDLR